MAKTTKKRTVTCGECKEEGHNARTCPTKAAPKAETKKEVPTPPVPRKTKIDMREEERRVSTVPRRDAPTADMGSAASAAPYRCAQCNAVAILVIVRAIDHVASHKKERTVYKGETRCEKCMNKPTPAELILKWGASPNEKIDPSEIPGNDG